MVDVTSVLLHRLVSLFMFDIYILSLVVAHPLNLNISILLLISGNYTVEVEDVVGVLSYEIFSEKLFDYLMLKKDMKTCLGKPICYVTCNNIRFRIRST